ncbi:unnamed protein product [Phytophthora fragariaefolia]|uniref:Unnamed protein product n=1 Tax=Phytophthora fragariaefolia TaxID=1490495 RepID=A0A9W6XIX6_9STRA|nr:unnamed protein product [Phytophthora fragariaefolia]
MSSLTPTRTKTTTKSGKTKRVTRRRTKDTLARRDDDDEEKGGPDVQDPPSANEVCPETSGAAPAAEDAVTMATTQHEAEAETPRDVTEAAPTLDECDVGIRQVRTYLG